MKLHDFYTLLNVVAPKALSDEYCAKYGAYDNSGILVDTGADVTKALFSLDLSLPLTVEIYDDNCTELIERLKKFEA